jgi:phosphoribosylformylglycinamidine cyclo-ligase
MPGLYDESEYDISGTIVGIVERTKIINGSSIVQGDLLFGFKSNGLHTNGYSLARKVLLEKYKLTDRINGLTSTLGEELLRVHKSYLKLINALKEKTNIKGLSHITGGGIVGNTIRIIPEGLKLNIFWEELDIPPIFKLIQTTRNIPDEEMRKVFNMGSGLIAVVSKEEKDNVIEISKSMEEETILIGEVI